MKSASIWVIASLVIACSSGPKSEDVRLLAPEFRVRQLTGQMAPSRFAPAQQIEILIDVFNRSAEEITLEQIQLQAVAGGGYTFASTTRNYRVKIAPGGVETAAIWVEARLEQGLHEGGGPPVRVRGIARFIASGKRFQEIFTETVIEHGREGMPPG